MTDPNVSKNTRQCDTEWQKINTGHDTEEVQVHGYEKSYLGTVLTILSYIITFGCVRLFFHWYPHLHLYATHKKCSLKQATRLLITDNYQGKYKSYFVKDIQLIGTTNVRSKKNWRILENVDDELLKNIEGKNLLITLENGTKREVLSYRAFWFKKKCYIWDDCHDEFSGLVGFDHNVLCSELHLRTNKGLSKEEQLLKRLVYGNNEIIIPIQSIWILFWLEVLNPFYIFQVFTIFVWLAEGYYYYIGAIICMSIFGITSTVFQTRQNQKNLHEKVVSSETVRVQRSSGEFETISSADLAPGDVIELPKYQGVVVCDAVLLNGNCILNESMLTGESVPVTKTPITPRPILFDSKESSQHILYSGTLIIQTRYYGDGPVLARVIKTGLITNRGGLVTAILYPPPADFKFDQDTYKFIRILTAIAFIGLLYTVILKIQRGMTVWDITIKALDIITIVIPPALPAAMTVGKLYAQSRLKKDKIYCINSRVINVTGSLNCICFDKTGTLTEDGLDMMGIVPVINGSLTDAEKNIQNMNNHPLFEGMLVCHSLTLIDNELCGDPLDVKMFESTGWILEEPQIADTRKYDLLVPTIVKPPNNFVRNLEKNIDSSPEIGIIQQYPFSSSLQRMSVIVRVLGTDHFRAYTKGSPEMIISLSKPSTVPSNIVNELQKYTEQGYRVIAFGRNMISTASFTKIRKMHRNNIEKDLEFLGLVIMENRLKEPTIRVIEELREANLHVVMITGDNIQTAVSVARDCKILSRNETVIGITVTPGDEKISAKIYFNIQGAPATSKLTCTTIEAVEAGVDSMNYRFALTGQTWELLRQYFPELLPKICVRGAVFARMTSDQKQQLILELMELSYYVAMCGDGANDCGALRAAHAGISLSEAESSVASPFTSQIPDITCVPKVIRQGRAGLVTSFGIFKFMVTYSLTECFSALILYSIDSNLTDFEFLFIDIALIVNFAFFFGKTKAYEGKLAPQPPMTSILSFTPCFSLILHMAVIIAFQIGVFFGVQNFPGYTEVKRTYDYDCVENYSVFCLSMFQYITMAVMFSRGKPYRKAIYTNNAFICSILSLTIFCMYITLYPANWIVNSLQLNVSEKFEWRIIIIILAFVYFFISLIIETFIIEFTIEKKVKPMLYNSKKSKKKYLVIEHELRNQLNWPKLNIEIPALSQTSSVDNIIDNFDHKNNNNKNQLQGVNNPVFIRDTAINEITKF